MMQGLRQEKEDSMERLKDILKKLAFAAKADKGELSHAMFG